jgi:hypothetical protein
VTETRRRTLTPITGEDRYEQAPARVSRLAELRRRRPQRSAPTTWQGALKQGLKRLTVMLWAATMLSLLLDKFVLTGRDPGLGFYAIGGTILTGVLASANGVGGNAYNFTRGNERERRVNSAFSYFLVGALVLVIGALIETFIPSWQL